MSTDFPLFAAAVRQQILAALSTKEMQELSAASREELLGQLAALEAE